MRDLTNCEINNISGAGVFTDITDNTIVSALVFGFFDLKLSSNGISMIDGAIFGFTATCMHKLAKVLDREITK